MMISPTGKDGNMKPEGRNPKAERNPKSEVRIRTSEFGLLSAFGFRPSDLRGFTLIELIVVMTLLVAVISIALPSLGGFFRGRTLDSEARRLLSLTRQGQSRAVSEGLPVVLWVDAQQRTYGLEVDSSFNERDSQAMNFTLDRDLRIEVINVNVP